MDNPVKSTKNSFRAFFALTLPFAIKQAIGQIIIQLKQNSQLFQVKWTRLENLHLTMRFLGNITPEEYFRITKLMNDVVYEIEPFTLKFSKIIIFPNESHPVAIALKPEPLIELVKLNRILENTLRDCKIHQEKRGFAPHLTLGKIRHIDSRIKIDFAGLVPRTKQWGITKGERRNSPPCAVRATERQFDFPLFEQQFQVKYLGLFMSEPTAKGSVYNELVCFPFRSNYQEFSA